MQEDGQFVFQKHRDITLRRLEQFASEKGLLGLLYPKRVPVALQVNTTLERVPYKEAISGFFEPLEIGKKLEPLWSTHWVRVDLTVPQEFLGHEVHFLWDSSCEACLFIDGQPRQGLTGSTRAGIPGLRRDFRLFECCDSTESKTLFLEVACNTLFGVDFYSDTEKIGTVRQAELAVFDREVWDLLWDFIIIADAAKYLPVNTPRAGQALQIANAMVNQCDFAERRSWKSCRALAASFFADTNGGSQHNISAMGHAHIDTAWLWPIAETKRKCVRTLATTMRLMEDHPDYRFVCSQAQQWEWIGAQQPQLYEEMRLRVSEGRLIPVGGSWVEPDCNIPSGESLVRQFLFGQRFFQREFGITCQEFWNPDVFGYSGALPQIMRGVGIKYFLTQKLSWNQFNKFPHHSFWWEGIDGSRVLAHFPPTDTYNSLANVQQVMHGVTHYRDHDRSRESALLFGFGDGGGGPTREMLEMLSRMKDVDGIPRVTIRSPQDFFTRLEDESSNFASWVGELFFELHRGTYTTQAQTKRLNALCERRLHDVEYLYAVLHVIGGVTYPQEEIAQLWKRLLTNQFHDIIPGSSIAEVYVDSTRDFEFVLQACDALWQQALSAPSQSSQTIGLFNTLSRAHSGLVAVPQDRLPAGLTPLQLDGLGNALMVAEVPAYGFADLASQSGATCAATLSGSAVSCKKIVDGFVLENERIRAVFALDGGLTSLFDKTLQRESIAAGAVGNRFVLFEDRPLNWDAWDVDVFHLEKRREVGTTTARLAVLEEGPLRATLMLEMSISPRSQLRQTISLNAGAGRLEFHCEVDWDEEHEFLKVEFPLKIRTDFATYEIQFGSVKRPTHMNTSWDLARFEVSGHRWMDLSEAGFGVALLNDCKYGMAAHGNTIRLSLLRSAKYPDAQADIGKHLFAYALFPHSGSPYDADVAAEAHRFSNPLRLGYLPALEVLSDPTVSLFSVDHRGIILDTVKKAEESAALIVRLYEAYGSRGTCHLSTVLPVKSATRCNLLEEDERRLDFVDGKIELDFEPFQLITLKLEMVEGRCYMP